MTQSDRRLIGLTLLSLAVLINFGKFSFLALMCLLLSIGVCIQSQSVKTLGPALPRWAGIAIVLSLAGTTLLYDQRFANPVFLAAFPTLAVAILLYTLVREGWAKYAAFGLAGISAFTGIFANMTWGYADIDVFQFQQEAARALLHGQNLYSPVVSSPQMVAPGIPAWVGLHFPYGPVLPVLEAPFRLLGDVRILHAVAALITSIAVLALARRAGTLDRTACVVMAFPLTVGMVIFSWVDVITMAGLAVWLVCFRSHPKMAIFALVLALGVKPTTLIALVPIFFWSVRARRQVTIAAIFAALFALPFAIITGVSQFYYNVLGVQLSAFPRFDGLTINSYLFSISLPVLPFAVLVLVIAATTLLVVWRRPNTYGELLTGTAVLTTVSFLVAKWAFFNYYYIPAVLLMLAIAGDGLPVDVPEMIRPPAVLLTTLDQLRRLTPPRGVCHAPRWRRG